MSSNCFNKSLESPYIFCKKNNNINKELKEKHTIKNENYKKFNKKLKIKILSILLLIISITLFVYFIRNKNYKINDSRKINKNNNQNISNFNNSQQNKMKHAILLLSSYGVDYLNNFLVQFKNDSRFDIYIHLEGKSQIDYENGETIINSNIKYCKHIHQSKRFSIGMVDAMYDIMSIANTNYNYDFYHFFSESCYLVKSLDYFYKYFERNKIYSYIRHFLHNNFLYNNQSFLLYKGSQWMSINNDIMKKLIKRKNLFIKYKKEIENGIIKIVGGAPDEFIIQHIIIRDICKGLSLDKCNVKNTNLRFIRWSNCSKEYCPNLLDISNVSEEELNYIINNYLVIRKINYKNPKAIELINKIKSLS